MRSDHERDIGHFNQWAPTYERSIAQTFFFGPVHRRILKLVALVAGSDGLPTPRTIVDVGSGTGRLLRLVERRWPDARLFGIDPAEAMVAEARRLAGRAEILHGSAESIPLGDDVADIVFSSISFHHWRDQPAGVKDIVRILRPGGLFCLADHTFLPARLSGERVRSRREIRGLMQNAGLSVVGQWTGGRPFVAVSIARKHG